MYMEVAEFDIQLIISLSCIAGNDAFFKFASSNVKLLAFLVTIEGALLQIFYFRA